MFSPGRGRRLGSDISQPSFLESFIQTSATSAPRILLAPASGPVPAPAAGPSPLRQPVTAPGPLPPPAASPSQSSLYSLNFLFAAIFVLFVAGAALLGINSGRFNLYRRRQPRAPPRDINDIPVIDLLTERELSLLELSESAAAAGAAGLSPEALCEVGEVFRFKEGGAQADSSSLAPASGTAASASAAGAAAAAASAAGVGGGSAASAAGAGVGGYPRLLGDEGDQKKECVVCLGDFKAGELLRRIKVCRHVFHQECVDAWLSSHASCPLCRTAVVVPRDQHLNLAQEEGLDPESSSSSGAGQSSPPDAPFGGGGTPSRGHGTDEGTMTRGNGAALPMAGQHQ